MNALFQSRAQEQLVRLVVLVTTVQRLFWLPLHQSRVKFHRGKWQLRSLVSGLGPLRPLVTKRRGFLCSTRKTALHSTCFAPDFSAQSWLEPHTRTQPVQK